ncbi:hypothetical protein IZY60_04515 [Lutibacter sp. B2]|nr:hypothetical protein [Lutibacter sp. B2]
MNFYKRLSQYYDIIFPTGTLQLEFIKKYSSTVSLYPLLSKDLEQML